MKRSRNAARSNRKKCAVVARLITLEPREIPAIVAAYSKIDSLDHELASDDIQEAMDEARRALQDAITAIDHAPARCVDETERSRLIQRGRSLAAM